ncbi:MAG: hypothetical protein WD775_07250 [Burkholderiales bacterium]
MGHAKYLYQLPAALLFAAAIAATGGALDQAKAPLPRDSAAPYSCDACIARALVRVESEPNAKEHVLAWMLKDTLRTATALIGCGNAGDRAVRAPTATAGIRW